MSLIKGYTIFLRLLLFCLAAVCILAACHQKTANKTSSLPPPALETVDMALIQDYYNQGLQFYADENFLEAKHAWLQVIKLGPKTQLADRARVYVKKVNRMLKTLKEIEKKQ